MELGLYENCHYFSIFVLQCKLHGNKKEKSNGKQKYRLVFWISKHKIKHPNFLKNKNTGDKNKMSQKYIGIF